MHQKSCERGLAWVQVYQVWMTSNIWSYCIGIFDIVLLWQNSNLIPLQPKKGWCTWDNFCWRFGQRSLSFCFIFSVTSPDPTAPAPEGAQSTPSVGEQLLVLHFILSYLLLSLSCDFIQVMELISQMWRDQVNWYIRCIILSLCFHWATVFYPRFLMDYQTHFWMQFEDMVLHQIKHQQYQWLITMEKLFIHYFTVSLMIISHWDVWFVIPKVEQNITFSNGSKQLCYQPQNHSTKYSNITNWKKFGQRHKR